MMLHTFKDAYLGGCNCDCCVGNRGSISGFELKAVLHPIENYKLVNNLKIDMKNKNVPDYSGKIKAVIIDGVVSFDPNFTQNNRSPSDYGCTTPIDAFTKAAAALKEANKKDKGVTSLVYEYSI